jgi:hypothetical protein
MVSPENFCIPCFLNTCCMYRLSSKLPYTA